MLSVLIPTYNYNVVSLVKEVHQQCKKDFKNDFEILVFDDCSTDKKIIKQNEEINSLNHCNYTLLPKNVGRSAIRNRLANSAKYDWLVFLDADVIPRNKNFILTYVENSKKKVVYGGIINTPHRPKKPHVLRWLYTKNREQKSECSSNFFVEKEVMLQNMFDESINKYGYEDVLFFRSLEKKGISISFINNPVIHLDNESANIFIKKVEESLKTLSELIDDGKIHEKNSKLYYYYKLLSYWRLGWIVKGFFYIMKDMMLKNFNSSNPSLLLLDLYKLGYFFKLNSKK